nr:phosphatase PAP2 family protein [Gordonia humi]
MFDRVRIATSRRVELGVRGWTAAVALLVAFTLVIEVVSRAYRIKGPVTLLAHDFVGRPGIGEIKIAGLVLALVCLPARLRWWVLGGVGVLEGVWNLQRVVVGNPGTVGNGILFGLVATGLYALWRLKGDERAATLKAVGLGLMMPIMGRVGDAWLVLSSKANPNVLDEYVEVADRALGSPSWVIGRVVTDSAVLTDVLRTVYVYLPVGAAIIAYFQLRNVARDGFPRHHIVRTFLLIGMVGPVVYFIFPVVGPAFAFGHEQAGAGWTDVWPWVTPDITRPVAEFFDQSVARNCMPSLHTAWATCILLHGLRGSTASKTFGSLWFAATIGATLGFGFHYAIDVLAGFVFTLAVEAALTRPETGWTRVRMTVVASGALVFTGLLLITRFAAVPLAMNGAGGAILLLVPVVLMIAGFVAVEKPELLSVGEPGGPSVPPMLGERSRV